MKGIKRTYSIESKTINKGCPTVKAKDAIHKLIIHFNIHGRIHDNHITCIAIWKTFKSQPMNKQDFETRFSSEGI